MPKKAHQSPGSLHERPVRGGDGLSVAVLGLGRLGTAIATRLAQSDRTVSGWSRSGIERVGISCVASQDAAVVAADVVLLCLPDANSCRTVLGDIATSRLLAGRLVANLSTVAPQEATRLAATATAAGGRYVHVPVIGSVGAAAAGRLTLLAGGPVEDLQYVAPLLRSLGRIQEFRDPAAAAKAKLLAEGTLALGLLAVSEGVRWGAELGLEEHEVIDVLSRSALGGLVRANRTRISERRFTDAGLTVSALSDHLWLLADAAPTCRWLADHVAAQSDRTSPDSDVAELVQGSAPGPCGR